MNLKKIREYSRGNSGPCKRPRTPEHDSTGLNHARRPSSCLSMTSSENRFLLFRIMLKSLPPPPPSPPPPLSPPPESPELPASWEPAESPDAALSDGEWWVPDKPKILPILSPNAIVRPPRMALATLHSRHQQADQRRTADRHDDYRQRIVHGFPPLRRGRLVRRKKPRIDRYLSPNMATSFIDRSSEMWNFRCDRPLYPLSCSIRKVMP